MRFIRIIFCIQFFVVFCLSDATAGIEWNVLSKDQMASSLMKIADWYRANDSYSVSVKHNSFSDFVSTAPYEQSVGYIKRNKKNYHSFLLGIHTIQNEKIKLVIDSSTHQMALTLPDELFEIATTMEDYLVTLDYCKRMLERTNAAEKILRLEFDESNTIGACEFVSTKQGILKSIVIYYNHEIQRDEKSRKEIELKPRLEITFSNYKKEAEFDYKDEFDEKKYITYTVGTKPALKKEYKKYKLTDQRVLVK